MSYKIKFIDSGRFMTSTSSNLIDNLAEVLYKIKCKYCDCFLESDKKNLIKFKCLSYNKYYSNKIDENSEREVTMISISMISIISLLRKYVYPHEYMDDCEKFN